MSYMYIYVCMQVFEVSYRKSSRYSYRYKLRKLLSYKHKAFILNDKCRFKRSTSLITHTNHSVRGLNSNLECVCAYQQTV